MFGSNAGHHFREFRLPILILHSERKSFSTSGLACSQQLTFPATLIDNSQ